MPKPLRHPIFASAAQRWPSRAAFTLVELLIVIAIIGVLIALLIPAVRSALGTARGFKCEMSLRSVAFDFGLFADDTLHPFRGDDERDLSHGQFRAETFQDLQYGVDEFWAYGNKASISLPDAQGRDPMRCAEVRGDLVLRRNNPCTSGGVGPSENVSFGFNIRMHVSDRLMAQGRTARVALSSSIMGGGDGFAPAAIPLLWDVDGAQAASKGVTPLFSGPSLDSTFLLGDQYWFPGMRHNGAMNVGFLDGHVAATRKPLQEPNWGWSFDAGR
jgi:prepilin-type processing-associated H-X9-DG protein/prepilin-type N-terminal cleavage/methylation domain-containing protein